MAEADPTLARIVDLAAQLSHHDRLLLLALMERLVDSDAYLCLDEDLVQLCKETMELREAGNESGFLTHEEFWKTLERDMGE